MAIVPVGDSSLDSLGDLLEMLPEHLVDQVIKAYAVMQVANLQSQATQAAMAENTTYAFLKAVSTADLAARLVASSQAVSTDQAQLAILKDMQDGFLANVRDALDTTNSTLAEELKATLARVQRNGKA